MQVSVTLISILLEKNGGPVDYPLVPGHEIAGIVKEVGPDVTKYKVGDRVGVGCMVDSCGECENCKMTKNNIV